MIFDWHTSLYPHIFIVDMLQNVPYAHLKTTSLQDCVWQTMIFPYNYGIKYSCRWNNTKLMQSSPNQHMRWCLAFLTTIKHHLRHLDARYSSTKSQVNAERGICMGLKGGIWGQLSNIVAATAAMSTAHRQISDTVEFFPTQTKTLTITTTDKAIMAAEALIKALNNPTVFNNAEALCNTADNTLTKLSKVYAMNKELASPRVEEPPTVVPVPRVAKKPTATSVEPISAQMRQPHQQQPASQPTMFFYTNHRGSYGIPTAHQRPSNQRCVANISSQQIWQSHAGR
jgi:hypothetical protein